MKSFNKPTDELVDSATPLLSSPQHEEYFFARLENPQWIEPLAARDFFSHPPKVQIIEGMGVRFPRWAPSRYLARMAELAPAEVSKVLLKLDVDNPSVVGDFLDAALAMPVSFAVTLVPKVRTAANLGTLSIHFNEAAELCKKLAENSEADSAMTLAAEIFQPTRQLRRELSAQNDLFQYERGLKKVLAPLSLARPHEFLGMLTKWLEIAIKSKRHIRRGSDSDYSYLWRPAIEEHPQNRDYDFAGVLVGFAREGFEAGIRHESVTLKDALAILERYSFSVFTRLRLHLINEFAEQEPNLARETVMDRELIFDFDCKHEYGLLVNKRFGLLSPQQREEWLAWVDADSQFDADETTTSESTLRGKHRRFEKFYWVKDFLEGERKTFYDRKLAELGAPELAYLNVSSSGMRWGDESPLTVDELGRMSFPEAVDTVSNWKPEGSRFHGPSVEGLANAFGRYVAMDPRAYSKEAGLLENRPVIFVRTYLHQMREAVKAGTDIELSNVLDLCHWVVQHPIAERTTPPQEHDAFADKDWRWTRNEIAELIENVCTATANDSPKYTADSLRDSLQMLVDSLCRDRSESPSARDDSTKAPRVHDFIDVGINSSQGKAVKAALAYARWLAEQFKVREGERDIVPGGFATMPEVKQWLELLIDEDTRSFEGLSVLGSQFGLINWIDRRWLLENANRIFQLERLEETPPHAEGWAAWNSYLVWGQPHREYYQAFRSQFHYAVQQAAHVELPDREYNQPMNHLGEHLMVLYGRGDITLESDESLLRRFLETANSNVRRHAIGLVGRNLTSEEEHEKVEVPRDVIERFQVLWETYWAGKGRGDALERPQTALFGSWFASGQFPADWALERLEDFVAVAPVAEPEHAVAKQLAAIAASDPERSVRILDQMIRGDREGWHVAGWRESARAILEVAMQANGQARETAVQLINFLGRRGYLQFGELLAS
jgi:hypothetical protein